MDVKCANDHIQQIEKICEEANWFYANYADLRETCGFMIDAIAFLNDYRKVLERAIENAELKL